jgi:hypothetical protein
MDRATRRGSATHHHMLFGIISARTKASRRDKAEIGKKNRTMLTDVFRNDDCASTGAADIP